jgi:hypothetical protein
VDDDDIQSGTRDVIELKPHQSNEDAFFIMPERKVVFNSILFIQTAIDQLKRFLLVISTRNLELSKDKQKKVFECLDRIEEFLVGDTNDINEEAELASGFSKDYNDMQQKRKENLQLRQKLIRELYLVEMLVQTIFLPFSYGDYDLLTTKTTDIIAKVCKKVYNLIKNIGAGYYQNELYVSQWINLYFKHAIMTNHESNIGAEDTIISLVDNNKKLLEIQITPTIINHLVKLCI